MTKYFMIFLTFLLMTGCDQKINNYDSLANSLKNKYDNYAKLEDEEISGIYGIDTSLFNNTYIRVDNKSENPNMYAIFELGSDKDACTEEVEYFIEKYKKSWSENKSNEQIKLVENGKKEEIGNYIIYVVSDNPDEVIDTIKGFIK